MANPLDKYKKAVAAALKNDKAAEKKLGAVATDAKKIGGNLKKLQSGLKSQKKNFGELD